MPHGKSIRIFLMDGTVTGIRHAEVYNWTGQAVACPRKRLTDLKGYLGEDDVPGTEAGVYFLIGQDETGQRVYVGESENAIQRVGHHLRTKDFWNDLILVTSKDRNLTKAHLRYLESNLIQATASAERADLDNGDRPTPPRLAPAERAPMDEFVDNVRIVLGALGFRFLEPLGTRDIGSSGHQSKQDSTQDVAEALFHFETRKGAEATGEVTDEGFLVHSGSHAQISEADSLRHTYREKRAELCEAGKLEQRENSLLFRQDVLFPSPSYAATVVAGSSRSGPQSWQDNHGKTLGEYQDDMADFLERGKQA